MELESLETKHHQWNIDEIVEVANQLLPNYLPEIKGNSKVKEEINSRLIREYTSRRLIDEPTRKNRYAFYTYRHLLQLLLVRRLLSDGISTSAINGLLTSKTNEELKNLLVGGISFQITTAHPNLTQTRSNQTEELIKNNQQQTQNSALDYLANLKKTSQNPNLESKRQLKQTRANQNYSPVGNSDKISQTWNRLEVLEGLELHIRSDFVYPNSLKEQESLNAHLIEIFSHFLTRNKP